MLVRADSRGIAALPDVIPYLIGLIGAGVCISIYPVGLLLTGGLGVPEHVRLFFAAFVAYLAAVALVLRSPATATRSGLAIVLTLAIAWRLIMLQTAPSLSDDVYRYVWDGKLSNAGVNPYLYPPNAPELAGWRDQLWAGISSQSQATPYPPFAQAIFAVAYRVQPDSLKSMQAAAAVADLLAIGAVLLLLRATKQDAQRVLIYAWSPVTLVEFTHSAHNDAWMIAFVVAAVVCATGRRPALSGAALALGTLAKFLPVLLVPLLLRRWGLRGLLSYAAVFVVGYLPFLSAGPKILSGVLTEAGDAQFNDSLFLLATRSLNLFTPDASSLARWLLPGAIALGALVVAAKFSSDLAAGAYWLFGLYLLATAVVEPWYLTWLLPWLAVRLTPGSRLPVALGGALGWLLFSGLIQVTNLTYGSPPMLSWPIVRLIEYAPLYGLLLWSVMARLRGQPTSG